MVETLNERLVNVKRQLQSRQKWKDQLMDYEVKLQEKQQFTADLKSKLEKNKKDLKKLDTFSFTHMLAVFTGRKEERIRQKQNEIAAITVEVDESHDALTRIQRFMVDIQNKLNALPDLDHEYESVLERKEQLMTGDFSPLTSRYNQHKKEISNLQSFFTETEEAIEVGENVKRSLTEAIGALKKAKRWGGLDMLSGRGFVTHMKHKHINNAKVSIQVAQTTMRLLYNVLLNIDKKDDLKIEISGLLTFADFVFDGIFMTYIVQKEIENAFEQTKRQKSEVDKIIIQLNFRYDLKKKELHRLEKEKTRLLENFGA